MFFCLPCCEILTTGLFIVFQEKHFDFSPMDLIAQNRQCKTYVAVWKRGWFVIFSPNCSNHRRAQAVFTTFKLTYATSAIRYRCWTFTVETAEQSISGIAKSALISGCSYPMITFCNKNRVSFTLGFHQHTSTSGYCILFSLWALYTAL